jgi:hypothetical protein
MQGHRAHCFKELYIAGCHRSSRVGPNQQVLGRASWRQALRREQVH